MAYSINQQSGKNVYNKNKYTVDEFADMEKLPVSCAPGSTAFVVATSQTFMLNNKRQWVEVAICGSSGGSGSGYIIWDGGDPKGNHCCGGDNTPDEMIWDGGEMGNG